jgi:D-alanyl-D-alanine carboxypeptidase (penicillin-binding protein 5/6)
VLLALAVALAALAVAAVPAGSQEPLPPGDEADGGGIDTTAPGFIPNEPAAWVLVDADTGALIDGRDARTPRLPASTIKLFTALVAIQRLPADDPVPISSHAAGMPARRIVAGAGQVWDLEDLLNSMLTVSANDAAVAVAERVGGGTMAGWEAVAARAADGLGLEDSPDLSDPAGLDDEFAYGEGSHISARDMAIVARAVLADPRLIAMVTTEEYRFTGGDGIVHSVDRRNRLPDLYPDAFGLKTGLTEAAGRCLVAAARRDGRTMVAVLFDAPDMYASAALLLDRGFATSVAGEATMERLPEVVPDAAVDAPELIPGAIAPELGPVVAASSRRIDLDSPTVTGVLVLLGSLPALALRRRLRLRRFPDHPDA